MFWCSLYKLSILRSVKFWSRSGKVRQKSRKFFIMLCGNPDLVRFEGSEACSNISAFARQLILFYFYSVRSAKSHKTILLSNTNTSEKGIAPVSIMLELTVSWNALKGVYWIVLQDLVHHVGINQRAVIVTHFMSVSTLFGFNIAGYVHPPFLCVKGIFSWEVQLDPSRYFKILDERKINLK